MDAYQVLVLLAAHSARHTAQIREVEANTAYPKSASARPKFLVACSLRVPVNQFTPEQIGKLQEHGAYIIGQAKKGVIVWGGRTADPVHPHGYLELDVASEAAAKEFVANDPAAKAGLFDCTVDAFDELVRTGSM